MTFNGVEYLNRAFKWLIEEKTLSFYETLESEHPK